MVVAQMVKRAAFSLETMVDIVTPTFSRDIHPINTSSGEVNIIGASLVRE